MTLVYLVDTRYRRNLRVSNSSLATNARRRMEEFERLEHARLVWIRHCLTAPSLLKPDVAPWTYIWLFGPDKNLLNVTDLSR
ncbi:hypothetical protein JG687_00014648 [Phytophthora cactorum]|uniref:Uncharacterized protein n=1 Tax=Phytophthora cactorum TaxID=29920 RepID=A0A8T1TYT8_9STRA|nr:hypothetical protein JG687_00014648 [Phytophthora cactorum]